jgi:hypothetical protein
MFQTRFSWDKVPMLFLLVRNLDMVTKEKIIVLEMSLEILVILMFILSLMS